MQNPGFGHILAVMAEVHARAGDIFTEVNNMMTMTMMMMMMMILMVGMNVMMAEVHATAGDIFTEVKILIWWS